MLFLKWLTESSKVILGDGSNGTELMNMGLEPGKLPDILNVEDPEKVRSVLKAYYDSGADMVQTPTLNANYLSLKRHGLADKIEEINKRALENIKEVCPPGKMIIGEIGSSGEFRKPLGTGSFEKWKNGFMKQVEVLEGKDGQGVDVWHALGFVDIEEMAAALAAIKEISIKPIIASFIINKGKRGFYTIMGCSIEECIQLLEKEEVDVIGANCDPGSTLMIDWVKEAKKLTDFLLSVKPNAGKPSLQGMRTVYNQPVEEFVRDIASMIDLGVKIVGGCCGVSPKHIRLVREHIDSLKQGK